MADILREPPAGGWGGPWTEKKLDAFIKYVKAYLTIMNKYHWKTIYFDGFAGSGERRMKKDDDGTNLSLFGFGNIILSNKEETVYQGAAERIMRLPVPYKFDYYYFVEKNHKNIENLKKRLSSIPEYDQLNPKPQFKIGDCNKWLNELSMALKSDPKKYASLVFIDPFGMQVDWSSIEKLKGTRSDVWILIPTGVIVNRLLDKKGELKYINKLKDFFGMSEKQIREKFYPPVGYKMTSLFDGKEIDIIQKVKNPINRIAQIYIENMQKVWSHVTKNPLVLYNNNGLPLFHFVFASNNASALKIAKHIIV
ncbi:MAG TPA: three-Cys-motif partner protein TcmP, partial [Bacteroidetes bacterium]|nr:three-Cys-motif partner protein TcmP [Bacteroidota bacterium]